MRSSVFIAGLISPLSTAVDTSSGLTFGNFVGQTIWEGLLNTIIPNFVNYLHLNFARCEKYGILILGDGA